MGSSLVLRPPYGEGKKKSPKAVAELPSGGPTDKGLPLDPGIPGASTYAKPPEDIRNPQITDTSPRRIDGPDDMLKDRDRIEVREDSADSSTSYNGLGEPNPPNKTKYPYRDEIPNAHNAAFIAELWKLEGSRVAIVHGSDHIRVASTVDEILTGLDPKFRARSKKCSAQVKRADLKNLRWIFSVDCGNGPKAVKVRALPKGKSRKFSALNLELSCSCPAWQWLGPEYHAKHENFMLKPQVGTASTPDVRDPERDNRVCKHVAAALALTQHWEIPKVKLQRAVKKAVRVHRAVQAAMTRRAQQLLWATESLSPENWNEGLRMDWVTPKGVVTAYIRARGDLGDYAEFQIRREGTCWPKVWNKTRDLVGAIGRLGITRSWAFVPPKVQVWLQEKM